MHKILRNPTMIDVHTHFRGREIYFPKRRQRVFNLDDEEERAEYTLWKSEFGFLYDRPFKEVSPRG